MVGLTSVPPTRKVGGSDEGLQFVLVAEVGGLDGPPSATEIACHRRRHGFVQSACLSLSTLPQPEPLATWWLCRGTSGRNEKKPEVYSHHKTTPSSCADSTIVPTLGPSGGSRCRSLSPAWRAGGKHLCQQTPPRDSARLLGSWSLSQIQTGE